MCHDKTCFFVLLWLCVCRECSQLTISDNSRQSEKHVVSVGQLELVSRVNIVRFCTFVSAQKSIPFLQQHCIFFGFVGIECMVPEIWL